MALTNLFGDREGGAPLPAAGQKNAATAGSRRSGQKSMRAGSLPFLGLVRSFRHIIHRIVTGCALACKKFLKTSHPRHHAYTTAMSPMRHNALVTFGNADSYQSLTIISA